MKKYFMGVDAGTHGIRVGIADEQGEFIAMKEVPHPTEYPAAGYAEQNAEHWWVGLKEALRDCLSTITEEQRKNIITACVCATSSTVIPVNEDINPLTPAILWMDTRAVEQADRMNATNHPILKYCGDAVSPEWMLPKVLWIKENQRDIYDKSYKIIEQLDYLNYKLCGVLSSSICQTTCKWNYVESEGGYQRDFMEAIGFGDYEDKLVTRVDKIGVPLGKITEEFAREFDLNPDLLVVQGAIDAHMAMFGLNVIEPNKIGVIMGTSFVHLCLAEEKREYKGIWGPYDGAVIDKLWLLEGGQISAASVLDWYQNNFYQGASYETIISEAEQIPIGCDGLVALDFFQGNRTPYKTARAKGVYYGLKLTHTKAHLYRALLEAVAFGTANIIKNFEDQGYPVNSLIGCGGVTKNRLWMQIISDVTGKPIVVNQELQAGVLGCNVVAAASGHYSGDFLEAANAMVHPDVVIQPNMDNHKKYEKVFNTYIELYQNLADMMEKE
ncbi:MAG: carbohydrate kinase [Lachnospiraceae bacterium]|jgi:ribulokinase|nr:carbohydrate kinase [Lachnospiraceae bacterium]